MAILGLMSFHFWRVRKDGGLSIPRKVTKARSRKKRRPPLTPICAPRVHVALVMLAILIRDASSAPL
jgi:hypothetical protein